MSALPTPKLGDCWQSMTLDRYAALEQATGAKVTKVGDIWWRQVRPFLYRPLLPSRKYDLKKATTGLAGFGAFQHGVEDGQPYNSYLNPIVVDEPRNYDVKKLCSNVQRNIRKALKNLTISRITDESEFCKSAYSCYMSFYERTKYAFGANRRQPDEFARWSHALFQFPETVVLGAFVGHELLSFKVCCPVEDTLILKALVNSDKALKLSAPDLLMHACRLSICEQPNIRTIFDCMHGQNAGISDYYVRRGSRVLALPAFLHVHPAIPWLIKKANKNVYERLLGLGNDELHRYSET